MKGQMHKSSVLLETFQLPRSNVWLSLTQNLTVQSDERGWEDF